MFNNSVLQQWKIIQARLKHRILRNLVICKLIRFDSSTNFLLNSGTVQNSDNRQEIEGVSFFVNKGKIKVENSKM